MSSQEEVITEDEEEEWKESEHDVSESEQSEMETDTIDVNSDEMETVQSDSYSDSDGSIFRFLNIRPPETEKKMHEDFMEKDQIERSLHFDWDMILDKMEECYSCKQLADYVN